VGENTLLCGQVGLACSSEVGNNVILAGQAAVAATCMVGDGVILTRRAASRTIFRQARSSPARRASTTAYGCERSPIFQRLPELLKRLDRVEKKLAAQAPAEGDGARNEDSSCHFWQFLRGWRFLCRPATRITLKLLSRNHTGGPIRLLEVEYPSASFGVNT